MLDSDFIPDFSFKNTFGNISATNSKMKQFENKTFVSVFTKLQCFESKSLELLNSFGSVKNEISCFLIENEFIVIGYKNGKIEIIDNDNIKNEIIGNEKVNDNIKANDNISEIFHVSNKKITSISSFNDQILITSADGTVSFFDKILKIFINFKITAGIINAFVILDRIYSLCSDKCVRILELKTGKIADLIIFDDFIFDAVKHGNEIFLILKSGESKLILHKNLIDQKTICTDQENLINETKLADQNIRTAQKTIFTDQKNLLDTKTIFTDQKNLLDTKTIFTDQKNFEVFKGIKKLIKKENKVSVYHNSFVSEYEITKKDTFGFVKIRKLKIDQKIFDFDFFENGYIYISNNNFGELKEKCVNFFCNHQSEIIAIQNRKNNLFSLSKESLILWNISDSLEFVNFIKNDQTFFTLAIYNDLVFLGTNEGIFIHSAISLDLIDIVKIGAVRHISINSEDGMLAACQGDKIQFYKIDQEISEDFKKIDEEISENFKKILTFHSSISSEDSITHSLFYNNLFCFSSLDSKIYIYNYPSMDLKLTLYGHSLPVKSFNIFDQKLFSCGSDKLVKMWGLDFGECRKSFIGNSKNVERINSGLFMFSNSDSLEYYNGMKLLKKFSTKCNGLIKLFDTNLIVSCKQGLGLFKMNEKEYLEGADSDDGGETKEYVQQDVSKKYDQFLKILDDSQNNHFYKNLINFLSEIDFSEMNQYLCVLDTIDIHNILESIKISSNVILNARIFLTLFKFHRDSCMTYKDYDSIMKDIKKSLRDLRDSIGLNIAKISLKLLN